MISISLLKKPIQNIIKFLYSVKPTKRHDDIIISTGSLFRKLFSFYTLIITYIPKLGHHNVVISTKSLFRIILNSNTLKNLSKNISKRVFLDFQRKKTPKNWSPQRPKNLLRQLFMLSVFACCRKSKLFFGKIKIHTFQTEDKSVIFPL